MDSSMKDKSSRLMNIIQRNGSLDEFKEEFDKISQDATIKKEEMKQILDHQFDDAEKCTMLMIASSLGNGEIVHFLINQKVNCEKRNINDWTALHFASYKGHANVVRLLLILGGCSINAQTNDGSTGLHLSAESGHYEATKAMLHNGRDNPLMDNRDNPILDNLWDTEPTAADDESSSEEDEDKTETEAAAPLSLTEKLLKSVEKNNLNEFKYLLKEVEDKDKFLNEPFTPDKFTWMMCAARHGSTNIVKYLIEKNCDVNMKTSADWTALMFASEAGHYKVVKMLLDDGADINAVTCDMSTSLHLAANSSRVGCVAQLLESRAKFNLKNAEGLTPLMIAKDRQKHYVITCLLEQHQEHEEKWAAAVAAKRSKKE